MDRAGKDELAEDAALFGIALDGCKHGTGEFAVLAENWDVVMAFMKVQTQWRYGSSGHRLGLDYTACKAALKATGVRFKKVFAGLQVMEFEVLEAS